MSFRPHRSTVSHLRPPVHSGICGSWCVCVYAYVLVGGALCRGIKWTKGAVEWEIEGGSIGKRAGRGMEGAQSSWANASRLIALSDSASAADGFFSTVGFTAHRLGPLVWSLAENVNQEKKSWKKRWRERDRKRDCKNRTSLVICNGSDGNSVANGSPRKRKVWRGDKSRAMCTPSTTFVHLCFVALWGLTASF